MTANRIVNDGNEKNWGNFVLKYWPVISLAMVIILWFIKFVLGVDDTMAQIKKDRITIESRVQGCEQICITNERQMAVLDDRTKTILDILKRMESRR